MDCSEINAQDCNYFLDSACEHGSILKEARSGVDTAAEAYAARYSISNETSVDDS